ncbi:MAG TPA: glycerol phosphate lipoteichoic acid synthase, partial [Bacillales bacterium]|nr:glycerol phosphate lipoteichoic acid synthase [Bacillales bacterium]
MILKETISRKFGFFLCAVIMFWLKTYAVYRTEFQLGLDNALQHVLLFINPISSTLFFLGIALFFNGKLRLWLIVAIDFVLSLFLYANVCYYRFFNDFITLPVILHPNDASELSGSALSLMHGTDIFYFTDTFLLLTMVVFKAVRPGKKVSMREKVFVMASALMIFSINLVLAEADRPQLLTRAFDREYLVKYLGAYNYSIYDMVKTTRSSAQRAFADSSDLSGVRNFTKSKFTPPA